MPSQKKIPRGFEIKNNLGPAPKSNAPLLVSGVSNRLELRPAYGDNLTPDYNGYPSKRRKIADSKTPPEVEEISPPQSFDPRAAENYRITRFEQRHETRREKESSRTLKHGHNPRTSTSVDQVVSVAEYCNLEKMMNTSKYSNRARKSIRLDQPQNTVDVDPLHLATRSEQQTGKHVTRSNYRGTARLPAQNLNDHTSHKIRQNGLRENGELSPHFIKQPRYQQQSADLYAPQDVPSMKRQRRASNQGRTLGRTQCLNKSFPPRDADLSGDELQGATTVGSNASSHSIPRNIPYQDKGAEVLSICEITSITATGLPPSIIPSSFSKNKPPYKLSDVQAVKSGEKERRWSIDLNYANAGEKLEGDALGLVFDEETDSYLVYSDGHNLATRDLGYSVHPKRLQKVLFHNAQVRFESSKTGHADRVLDIGSSSERDITRLLARLTNSGISVQSCGKLDRMFGHRLEEQQIYFIDDTTEEPRKTWDLVSTPCQLNNTKSERQKGEIGTKQRARLRDNLESSSEFLTQAKCKKIVGTKSELVALADAKSRGAAATVPPIRKLFSNTPSPSDFKPEIGNIHQQSPLTEALSAHSRLSIGEHNLASAWHSRPLVFPNSTPAEWKDLLEARDLERLDDGEYLNDNLIEFYLKYLKNQLEQSSPETAKKVYFFNTFFFASLTRKGRRGINYDAVQKWTRSIDIFSYDYVVVPICESQHWYVAIICNLPTLFKDRGIGEMLLEDSEDEPRQTLQDNSFRDPFVELSAGSPDRGSVQTTALLVGESVSLIKETETPIEQYPSRFDGLSLEPFLKSPEIETEYCAAQTTNGNSEFGTSDQFLPDAQAAKQVVQNPEQKEKDTTPTELGEKVSCRGFNMKAHIEKKKKRKPPPSGPRIDPNIPLIITFDSLGLSHPQTNKALKDYLAAEGKAKRAIELNTSQLKGITAKKIPHQENYSDCGLFLLGYIAKFLEGPKDFISRVIGQNYVDEDWETLIPRNLRAKIRAQIRTLLSDHDRKDRDITSEVDWHQSQQRQVNQESSSLRSTHLEATPLHAEHVSTTVVTSMMSSQKESLPLEESNFQGPRLYQMNGHARELSTPLGPAQPQMKPSHMPFVMEEHLHDAESPIQDVAQGKDRLSENALPVDESETWQPSVSMSHFLACGEAQVFQDSSDLLQELVISVRGESTTPRLENPSLQPQEDSGISTGINSSSCEFTKDAEQFSKYSPNDTQASIEHPNVIQDSQPTSIVDPLENQEVHRELIPQRKRATRSAPIIVEID